MEPMDLDEDSLGHTPPPTFPPTPTQPHRPPYPISRSVPPYSPIFTPLAASAAPSPFVPAPAPLFSTPQRPASASSTFGAQYAAAFSHGASLQNSFVTPVRRFARGAMLPERIDSAEGDRAGMKMMMSPTTSPGECDASIETSGEQRDVSEMEVGHNSPSLSPSSWDGLRLALSSFSLFKQEPEPEPDSVAGGAPNGGLQGEGGSKVVGSSWEPTLSTVEAAATFKQRKGRASPSKSPSKLRKSSSQSLEPGTQNGDEGMERHSHKTAPTTEQATAVSAAESPCSSCGLCVGVVSVLVFVAAAVCAFLLQRQASVMRETFARVDTQLLRNEMNSQVFGQHIAVDVVPKSIEQYLGALRHKRDAGNEDACSLPPLVLSFHGWTGVGKNFVSNIVTGLFAAKTLTKLLIPYHFPHQHLDALYGDQVENWILSNVTDYAVNFFVVDEMDKARAGVTEGIHRAISKLRGEKNSCRSPVVFLFLSNSFGTDINQRVFEAMKDGEDRGRLSVRHFSDIFDGSRGGKNSWYDRLRSDVTVAVPFLPLEKQHVVQCIRRHLVAKKLSTHSGLVSRVLQELMFTLLPSGQEFSQTGCKRVSDKVDLVAFE